MEFLLNTYLPIKLIRKYKSDKPWITENYKELIRKRQNALKTGNKLAYNFYRNRVNRATKSLRSRYYARQVGQRKDSSPKQWWVKTQRLLGLNSADDKRLTRLANEHCSGDEAMLACDINIFLQSVSSHLKPLDKNVIPDKCDIPDQFHISKEDVESLLMKIDISKAPGPDGIPNWILRDLASLISGPLCAIFNSSIRDGSVPEIWKSANITPIPKIKQPRDITSDIRPISLTPILSKCLEKYIAHWILESIEDKIDPNQFGGIRGLSTTHALVDMVHRWHDGIHCNKSIRILFLDYSKAFDLVDHTLLIEKFKNLGVPNILLRWLCNYLCDRKQRVRIGKEISSWLSLNGSMPQGSLLGPPVFWHIYL